ncbi:hypothetical protein HRbin11_01805 [bacterium HR11]|nr:hypothetical protein HRbin11_01805 [bacterium HR11]
MDVSRRDFLTAWSRVVRDSVHFDPDLVEEVLLLFMRRMAEAGRLSYEQEYRRLIEPLYERVPAPDREAAFHDVHRRLFVRWGLDRPIREVLDEFPDVRQAVRAVVIARALSAREEGADLSRDRPKVGLKVRSERFLDAEGFRRFLRHEFQHVADMLDPAFQYDPDTVPARPPGVQALLYERYRTLWAVTVDGRLERAGRPTVATPEDRWREFQALYRTLPEADLRTAFERLWSWDRPTHPALWAMAQDPRQVLAWARGSVESPAPTAPLRLPGDPCPLCRFPTHRWVDDLSPAVVARIRADFPDWDPARGLCERCAEAYDPALQP